LPKYGGKPNVITAVPDVKQVKVKERSDFIFLGCDGIFDKLSSEDVVGLIWQKARSEFIRGKSMHEICGECVNYVLQNAMIKRSFDNVTGVLIVFKHFKRSLKEFAMTLNERKTPMVTQPMLIVSKEELGRSFSPTNHSSQNILAKSMVDPTKKTSINFAGIKGLIEMSKRARPNI